MKPAFGTLNATLAKTIAANSPRYTRIVEPFADGGTYALHVGHKPPREHVINVVDEPLFAALSFVKGASGADLSALRREDWTGSRETFDTVASITATEGRDALRRFLYLKKFGMTMNPDLPPVFDFLKTGEDARELLYSLPMMRALLRRATVTNDDPSGLLGGAAGTFTIMLPKKPEDVELVQSRLGGVGGECFAAYKVADAMSVQDAASRFGEMTVSSLSVASIMMATMAAVTNYESGLVGVDELTGGADGVQ